VTSYRDYLYILTQLHNIENRLKGYIFREKKKGGGWNSRRPTALTS
jgi:hypothetical protein